MGCAEGRGRPTSGGREKHPKDLVDVGERFDIKVCDGPVTEYLQGATKAASWARVK